MKIPFKKGPTVCTRY